MNNYSWRGLMIDTARHMPSVEYLKETLARMSQLGLTTLHLHLSDDQGFRFESKVFPNLNIIGSYRRETVVGKNFPSKWNGDVKYVGDGIRYGGYYSQSDLKALVQYATESGIDIVPEIDVPGHATAILAAYPEFSENEPPKETATCWGIFSNVMKNSKESIHFLVTLLDEVMTIFPSQYIHLGGDEVPHGSYKSSPNDEKDILLALARHVRGKGRVPVFWDEASDVALETDGIIMNWRKIEYGIQHLNKGGSVVFCPNTYFYLDYYQKDPESEPLAIGGYLPIEVVSSFTLGHDILTKYGNQIYGIQANLWTEYMPTEQSMNYMLYPRLEAFARLKP